MSSKVLVIRDEPGAKFWKLPWDNPEIPKGHVLGPIYYHEALGVVVTRFNDLELYFRNLVGFLAGLRGKATDAVLTHVGAVTLSEALKSLANAVVQTAEIRDELLFCAKLFEVCRINRNFLVHNAREARGLGEPGMLMTKHSSRGNIKVEHYLLAVEAIRNTADEIHNACEYFALVIGPCAHYDGGKTLTLPHRPSLPTELSKSHPKGDLFDLLHASRPHPTPEDQ